MFGWDLVTSLDIIVGGVECGGNNNFQNPEKKQHTGYFLRIRA